MMRPTSWSMQEATWDYSSDFPAYLFFCTLSSFVKNPNLNFFLSNIQSFFNARTNACFILLFDYVVFLMFQLYL